MGKSNSKLKKEKVAFNRLPSLIREWDKTQQDNISKYQTSIIQRSALSTQIGYNVKTDGNNLIKNYLSNVFDSKHTSDPEQVEPLLTAQILENNQILSENEEDHKDEDEEEGYLQTYEDSMPQQVLSYKQKYGKPRTEIDVSSNQFVESYDQSGLDKHRLDIKKYLKKSSIIDEEVNRHDEEKSNFKLIYEASVQSVTKLLEDPQDMRTESFQDTLDHTDFKKEHKLNNKNYKQPSITQRFLNRNERFNKKGKKNHKVVNRMSKQQEQEKKEGIHQIRKQELQQKYEERKQKLDGDNFLKMNREQMLTNVSQIITKHIEAAELYIVEPTQAALLFHENNFIRHEWLVTTTSGYSCTMPLFLYVLEEIEYVEKPAAEGDVILFMRKIFEKMQLATECVVISLIYLEKVMINGAIEIRYCNWKPLLFTAILLASKFWEDINFWNVDYVEALGLYPLKSINRMESEYLSLCDFNLFVSAELYTQYYIAVRELNNQIFVQQKQPGKAQKPFNRFKNAGIDRSNSGQRLQKADSNIFRKGSENEYPVSRDKTSLSDRNQLPQTEKSKLPVFYLQKEIQNKGPQYPAIKVNVNMFKQEVADILEESLEEKRLESIDNDKKVKQQKVSKIQRMLRANTKGITSNNKNSIIQEESEDPPKYQINQSLRTSDVGGSNI